MKMHFMSTPQTRAEFERRLNLLHASLNEGRMHYSAQITRPLESMKRVRTLPNGRIDFLSIDQSTRLQANMMVEMDNENIKEDFSRSDSD